MSERYFQRLAVARHEVGHYIAARCLGFTPGDLTIKLWGDPTYDVNLDDDLQPLPPHACSCFVDVDADAKSPAAIIEWIDRRVQSLYAGALAQSLDAKVGTEPNLRLAAHFLATNAANDQNMIHAYVFLARNIEGSMVSTPAERIAQRQRIYNRNYDLAIKLVTREAEVIHQLARVVEERTRTKEVKMEKEDIEALGVVRLWWERRSQKAPTA